MNPIMMSSTSAQAKPTRTFVWMLTLGFLETPKSKSAFLEGFFSDALKIPVRN
ncbi:MAG: hypothetical protein ACRD45_23530 [Bryobacteraceae bacterium]